MRNRIIDLKIQPQYFNDVFKNIKKFELRKNDRDFKVGDVLKLNEFSNNKFTGRHLFRVITYILDNCDKYGLNHGFVILGISAYIPINKNQKEWEHN